MQNIRQTNTPKNTLSTVNTRRNRQAIRRELYFTLAHDSFQEGKIDVKTIYKGEKKEENVAIEVYETCMNLHGFPLYFTHTSKIDAIESHMSFCRIYRDF